MRIEEVAGAYGVTGDRIAEVAQALYSEIQPDFNAQEHNYTDDDLIAIDKVFQFMKEHRIGDVEQAIDALKQQYEAQSVETLGLQGDGKTDEDLAVQDGVNRYAGFMILSNQVFAHCVEHGIGSVPLPESTKKALQDSTTQVRQSVNRALTKRRDFLGLLATGKATVPVIQKLPVASLKPGSPQLLSLQQATEK